MVAEHPALRRRADNYAQAAPFIEKNDADRVGAADGLGLAQGLDETVAAIQ